MAIARMLSLGEFVRRRNPYAVAWLRPDIVLQ